MSREIQVTKEHLISGIPLGRAGEEGPTFIVFDLEEVYSDIGPDFTYKVLNHLPGVTGSYPVETVSLDSDETHLVWHVDKTDTQIAGEGECELVAMVGDKVYKSIVFPTIIEKALFEDIQPPEPAVPIIERIVEEKLGPIEAKFNETASLIADITTTEAVAEIIVEGFESCGVTVQVDLPHKDASITVYSDFGDFVTPGNGSSVYTLQNLIGAITVPASHSVYRAVCFVGRNGVGFANGQSNVGEGYITGSGSGMVNRVFIFKDAKIKKYKIRSYGSLFPVGTRLRLWG